MKMNIRNTVIKLAFLCFASMACMQTATAKQVLDKIVAVVNNDVISQYELENYTKLLVADLKAQSDSALPPKDILQEQALNRMVMDKIQLQLAEQSGIEVDSIMVSQALQHLAQQKGQTLEQLRYETEARGVNFDEYRELVRNELTIQRLQARAVSQDVAIAKSDIESFLSSPAGQDNTGTEYKISHILLLAPESPTPAALKQVQSKAEEIVASLKKGADFQKTAMAKSAGRQALNGGDLGWRNTGELPTLFVNYVPTMQIGDIVGPIRSAGGFHIIKLEDKRTANEEHRTETHVRHILIVPDKNTSSEEAKTVLAGIRKQIVKGADFSKIAAKKSQDIRSASKGGDMGWINEQSVLPKFYEVISKLRNNEISEPFLTEDGWNLVQVLDRRTRHTSDEAAWNRATEILTIRKTNEAIEAWTKRIRDEARVSILL
jgi:peptidyl-prolyl cis-trans isomerase SurA